ncbi:MAG: YbaB/EbfC family nucleoid-associated protein [SAR202 cluster bacterium]|nr:YbaB/EbfC family nucleoid-associated protein [SAR202 cluster bacterium]
MNQKLIRQAQELQKQMLKLQQELETAVVEGSAGGGAVKAVVTGKLKVQSVTISPEVASGGDVDMLQDLVTAAINDGLEKAQGLAAQRMSALTGGLKIPGLM